MKIAPVLDAMRLMNSVSEKRDGQARRENPQGQQNPQRQNDFEQQQHEASREELDVAIASFQKDSASQANGLTADATGEGPGLRVVLKDAQGAVLRQFTGEEFLRLREAASRDSRTRGKILDQKF